MPDWNPRLNSGESAAPQWAARGEPVWACEGRAPAPRAQRAQGASRASLVLASKRLPIPQRQEAISGNRAV